MHVDVRSHNRSAWNRSVEAGNRWTQAVSSAEIQSARQGKFSIVLTPSKPVPADWFPALNGTSTLCLAAAGGQQAPVLAAAGANVTVYDNSPKQLEQDQFVAERDGLKLTTVEGDMADLSKFEDASFKFIFHPCSNTFIPNVLPVWNECFRILKPGGTLLSGFTNAVRYIFDDERKENGNLEVKYPLPYSDLDYTSEPHVRKIIADGDAMEFGHTLTDQIGGQLAAGFLLKGFYEDRYSEGDGDPLSKFMDTFIATRVLKP